MRQELNFDIQGLHASRNKYPTIPIPKTITSARTHKNKECNTKEWRTMVDFLNPNKGEENCSRM